MTKIHRQKCYINYAVKIIVESSAHGVYSPDSYMKDYHDHTCIIVIIVERGNIESSQFQKEY